MHALDPMHSVMKHSVTQSHTEPSLCSAQRRLWWRGRGDCKPSFCLPQLCVGRRPTQPSAQIRAAIKMFYFTPAGLDPWGAHHSDIRARIELQTFPIKPLSGSFHAKRCLLYALRHFAPVHSEPVRKTGRAGHTTLKGLWVTGAALLIFKVTFGNAALWPKIWPGDLAREVPLSSLFFQICVSGPGCAHRAELLCCQHTTLCLCSLPLCP